MKNDVRRTLFILIYLFSISSVSFSQSIKISGIVVDSKTSAPLAYSTLSLVNYYDSSETNTISDQKGHFIIHSNYYGDSLLLKLRYIRYKEKDTIIYSTPNGKVKLGRILLLRKNKTLKAVTISAREKEIFHKFDRTVYRINKKKSASAISILDLLRSMPGITVDELGNIRYKGAKATLFVDELPIENQYPSIEVIPVDRVKAIELIDASMYTGGDGMGGIINIVMKPIVKNGISGLASTKFGLSTLKQLDQSKLYLNLNYKKGKFTYFLNSSLNLRRTLTNSITEKEYTSSIENTNQNILNNNNHIKRVNYNNVGIIFRGSANSKLVGRIAYYTLNSENKSNLSFVEHGNKTDEEKNLYTSNGLSTGNQVYKGISISYKRKLDTLNTYFKIYGNFNTYNIISNNKNNYQYIKLNGHQSDSTISNLSKRVNNNNSLYLGFFLNYSLSKNTRWNISYNFSSEISDTISDSYYVNSLLYLPQSMYDIYNSRHHNLSFRIGTKIKKWKIDGGITFIDHYISGRYTRFSSSSNDTSALITKNYYEFLPSATISYTAGKKDFFKLSLSKNANFPYYNRLVDFVDKQSIYRWKSGNSTLSPVYFYGLYLSHRHIGKNWNSSIELFYHYTNNEVEYISIPINSLTSLRKPKNIAQKSDYGVDLSFRRKFNKLVLSASSTFYYLIFDINSLQNIANEYSLYLNSINKKRFGYKAKLNIEYELNNSYSRFYINYNSLRTTYNGHIKPTLNTSFSISKKYFTNHLAVSFGIYNIFNTILEVGSYSDLFNVKSDKVITGTYYYRTIYLSLQYTFNKGDRGTKKYRIGN